MGVFESSVQKISQQQFDFNLHWACSVTGCKFCFYVAFFKGNYHAISQQGIISDNLTTYVPHERYN